jgi:putative DNA primase/helicase
LRNKGVAAYGIRSDGQRLILPLRDSNGRLHTLHFIDGDGSKRNLAGGRVLGCYHLIGEPNGTLCICEGYGAGASVHDATGHAVAVAVSTSNLKRVAEILRDKYPRVSLVLCADNDQWTDGNPGVDKATEAALAAEAKIAIPHFKDTSDRPTDFNDLMRLEGLKAVRKQLARASKPKLSLRPRRRSSSDWRHSQQSTTTASARLRPSGLACGSRRLISRWRSNARRKRIQARVRA